MIDQKTTVRVLVASLVVNMFLIGGILGYVFTGPDRPGGPPAPLMMAQDMAETLPAEDARILLESFGRLKDDLDSKWRMLRRSPDAFRAILKKSPFDETAAWDAWREFGDNSNTAHREFGRVLIESATRMSDEGRKRLAEFEPRKPPR